MAEAVDPIPVAVVGVGKIARDQHLPAIAGEPRMRLAAAVSRNASVDGVPNFVDLETYLAAGPKAAVALCTPPSARLEASLQAIAAGRDLLIEKPPAATLGEIETIRGAAEAAGVVLFATWHSRFAPGVAPAADWLKGRAVERVAITWKEDVRRWHPGQDWVWRPGGFGVFDPGINALSILTEILPGQMHVAAARLEVPENCAMPIGAELAMRGPENVPVSAVFDWRQEGPQTWDIEVVADGRSLKLSHGGGTLEIDGQAVDVGGKSEYPSIYRRFAELIATRQSDVDIAPLRICADAFLLGDRVPVAAFIE
ncbi:Gfo/Idh/MocA family protein [Solirhodobacter olei]|uniref:Gfo/Idh/MocA family protein n=1 Tax=Solirhodobacter olei TaxID=2493082 RepID=UPI000FDCCE8F|nr:Gfo/Idh/MocA family oxidoreductase [Solirhodobacter olei]